MKCWVMWDANFTGVPVEGLSGLVHDGDRDDDDNDDDDDNNNNNKATT